MDGWIDAVVWYPLELMGEMSRTMMAEGSSVYFGRDEMKCWNYE